MAQKTPGHIGKGTVRGWLENYQALISGGRREEAIPTNSGCKPDDGIPDALLNRIMLDQALEGMRKDAWVLYSCCKARWIDQDTLNFTLRRLGLTIDKYYRRCDWAISYTYFHVNHMDESLAKLVAKLNRIDDITRK